MTVNIEIQVFSDSMGDEWIDIDAAGNAYAQFLENRIIKTFPDADVRVGYHANLAGYSVDHVYTDDGDEDAIRDDLEHISERAWLDFCRSDEAQTL